MNKKIILLVVVVVLIIILATVTPSEAAAIYNISYLGNSALPRGIRNNNPGNLVKRSDIVWKGEVSNNTDGHFEQFSTFVYGVRAMIIDVKGDISRGQDTVRKLIEGTPENNFSDGYAPSSENNSAAYIAFLCSKTHLQPDEFISSTKEQLYQLVKAISQEENGVDYISRDIFNAAYKLI